MRLLGFDIPLPSSQTVSGSRFRAWTYCADNRHSEHASLVTVLHNPKAHAFKGLLQQVFDAVTLRFGKEKTAAKLVSAFERKTRMPVGRNERKAPKESMPCGEGFAERSSKGGLQADESF